MLRFLLPVLLTTVTTYAIAQNKIDTLETVDVLAEKAYLQSSSTHPTQSINGEAFKKMNAVQIADVAKRLAGVQIRDFAGIGGMKTINVRSLGVNHTAVFYDGIQLQNGQNGQIDVGRISLENIDVVALFNGQQANIFLPAQAFASANILWLEPKTPHFVEGKKRYVTATFRTGSFGLFNPAINLEQRINKNTALNISTEWLTAHGRYPFHFRNINFDTLLMRGNTDVQSLRIEMAANGRLPDSSSWAARFYTNYSDRGLPGAAVTNNYYRQDRLWDQDLFVQARWKKVFSNRYSLQLNGRYNDIHQRYLDPTYPNEIRRLDNRYYEKSAYLSVANLYILNDHLQFALSSDYHYNTLDANLAYFTYPSRNTALINAAVDWHYLKLRIQGNILSMFIQEWSSTNPEKQRRSAYTPSLSMSYQLDKQQETFVRAFYKRSFRMPTFNDLYYTLLGPASLQPEYVSQYNVGLSWNPGINGSRLKRINIETDAYYNFIRDRITAIPTANLFRWTIINLGEVAIKGIDIKLASLLQLSKTTTVDLGINYTLQDARDRTTGNVHYGDYIPYAPLSSGNAYMSINYRNWSLNYNALFSDRRYSLQANLPENDMPAFTIHDISLSKNFAVGNCTYRILAEANNVSDRRYQVIRNYPMPGRNYRLSVHFNY